MGPVRVTEFREQPLAERAAAARAKSGAEMLTDDDLLALALDEISRTITYEERSYGAGRSCGA
jgi:hypothetical protein